MGVHNRMTKERYREAKALSDKLLAEGDKSASEIDRHVARRLSIGESTARNVRRTKNYQEYLELVFRFHGHPTANKRPSSIVAKLSGKESKTTATRLEDKVTVVHLQSNRSDSKIIKALAVTIAVLSLLIVTALVAIIIYLWGQYVV